MPNKGALAKREAVGFHRRVKARREALGLSVEQMATSLDIHFTTYQRIESGSVGCTVARAKEIALLLDTSIGSLSGEAGEKSAA